MNGEVDISQCDNIQTDDNMDTSPPGSPASLSQASILKKPSQATSDSNLNNHTEDSSNLTENSNHTEYSNHTDDSNHSQEVDTKTIDNLSEQNRNDNLCAIEQSNHQVDDHCVNSNDSTTQFTSDSSQTKKKDDSSGSESETGSTHGRDINVFAGSNDAVKQHQALEEESDYDRDSDDSSEENSDASEEGTAEGDEDPVSINSDSGSESGNDKTESTTKKAEVLLLDDSSNHSGNVKNGPENKNGSHSPEIHLIGSDNDNDECTAAAEQNINKSNNDIDMKSNEEASGLTPRRSARAIKRKSYKENDDDTDVSSKARIAITSDIEEVAIEDPLNQRMKCRPIFVNDTKKLVDLAAKQTPKPQMSNTIGQKKEPTVVIIDTNSILSGKGPVPVQPKPYSLLPTSLSQQNLYQSIAARGTTVTPVSMKQSAPSPGVAPMITPNTIVPPLAPIILPSLTDDMFVVEAPSFIVPYVYEKPSVKPFREFVDTLGKELEERRKKEDNERLEKEKLEKEKIAPKLDSTTNMETDRVEENGDNSSKDGELADVSKSEKSEHKSKKQERKDKKRRREEDDDSWDGDSSSESDDEGTDEEIPKTVILKEKDDSLDGIKDSVVTQAPPIEIKEGKSDSYFDNSLGKFFISVGVSLVQEYVQSDLLKQQKRKLQKENRSGSANVRATESAIASLMKNLNFSKEKNAPYKFEQKKCEFCSFKTESVLVMAHHMETPHMKNNVYKCNFCSFEIRSPHDILFHMEAEHNIRGRLERAPAYHQCANCPFEDNGKGKLARHLIACAKKFKPELNLAPPMEWEPPAKIPKITRARNNMMGTYQAAFARAQVGIRPQINIGGTTIVGSSGIMPPSTAAMFRGRGRPQTPMQQMPTPRNSGPIQGLGMARSGVILRHPTPPVLLPPNYNLMGTTSGKPILPQTKVTAHQPSISITPLPRAPQPPTGGSASVTAASGTAGKGTFVICEICDGYIKDLEQLRNHMQWIHKVKIHPKMIYNRPPLNCQKCQFRFFTDQGLERHLLGSHGLVTSSMQEAANKGKDAGRCPVCGRVYQWKLLNHVARDHSMTLKPAHLSYKCTVCTATFGMYKQFENHVYSAHSVVAKRVMDKNKSTPPPGNVGSAPKTGDSMLKPLKINDEITIIPQPSKMTATPVVKAIGKGVSD